MSLLRNLLNRVKGEPQPASLTTTRLDESGIDELERRAELTEQNVRALVREAQTLNRVDQWGRRRD